MQGRGKGHEDLERETSFSFGPGEICILIWNNQFFFILLGCDRLYEYVNAEIQTICIAQQFPNLRGSNHTIAARKPAYVAYLLHWHEELAKPADDGLATEEDDDETALLPPEMHAEPASTAVAAQDAAKAVATVKAEEQKERARLEEDAIGMHMNLLQALLIRASL